MKKTILRKYAELIVKMGLNVKKGQEVRVYASTNQVELVREVTKWAYKVGAKKVINVWYDDELSKIHYKYQSEETLAKVEKWELERLEHRCEVLPCRLFIEDSDPDALKGVDQGKIAKARMKSYPLMKPYLDRVENKEQWCIVGAASKEWAKKVFPNDKVNVAVEKLWNAILATSRMTLDPIQEWKNHNLDLRKRCEYLNSLNLKKLHYTASNGTDLTVGLIPEGIFCGGSEFALGSNIEFNPNIPSEEVFTSPKKGEAEGIVYASKPLSYQGELIEDFSVRFENGKAVEVHARKGEELLKQMITMDETAAYLGECAVSPFDSPINNTGILFFNTLYDENASCHLALGMGFTNCIKDYEKYEKKELEDMGVNDSMIHVDFMIGTSDMKIVGITSDDQEVVIFENGNWAF